MMKLVEVAGSCTDIEKDACKSPWVKNAINRWWTGVVNGME
jgi:hypothetical protein